MTATLPRYAWLNGDFVTWDACVLHARSPGAFWGANVFEGVRAYLSADGDQLILFRLDDHLSRLWRSMRAVHLASVYPRREIELACAQLLRQNEYRADAHVVIVGYFGSGRDFDPLGHTDESGMHITACPIARPAAYERGAHICVSSWRRIGTDTMPPRVKAGANYHNSRLAFQEAARNGYDNAIILNSNGMVAEGPTACVAVIRDGAIISPPSTSGALDSITLATVAELAEREGLAFRRQDIDRTDLYSADEAFFCGTVAEIQPIVSVDRVQIGSGAPGPVTLKLQALYDTTVRGSGRPKWATTVDLTPADALRCDRHNR